MKIAVIVLVLSLTSIACSSSKKDAAQDEVPPTSTIDTVPISDSSANATSVSDSIQK